jgi:hypothetical protein
MCRRRNTRPAGRSGSSVELPHQDRVDHRNDVRQANDRAALVLQPCHGDGEDELPQGYDDASGHAKEHGR